MKFLRLISFLLFILSACGPVEGKYNYLLPWQLSDLRFLRSPVAPDPAGEMIAVYTRMIGDKFQIRLDLLDIQPDQGFDVTILLDTSIQMNPNRFPTAPPVVAAALASQRWDWLLNFPFGGNPQAYQAGHMRPDLKMTPRIQFDPLLDTVTINLNPKSIPDTTLLTLQVFITNPHGRTLLDQSPIISSDRPLSLQSAPLLLVFNDAFSATTPAQALRSWDGAHTGPIGSRHGLEHIISNVKLYGIPVTLLDLKTPTSLSALDFLEGLSQIEDLVIQDLLILPDVAFAQPDHLSLLSSQNAAVAFNLPGSQFVYSSDSIFQPGYKNQFIDLPDRTHLLSQSGRVLIPLPDLSQGSAPIQATVDGLDLEILRQLLATALSPDPTDLVVLGGNLPDSTWGNADISTASFAYIAAHPWIQPLNGEQLLTLGSQPAIQTLDPQPIPSQTFPIYSSAGRTIGLDSDQLVSRLLQDLNNTPKNTITDSAWQMYFSLTEPNSNPQYSQLNYQYLNQVESLLVASRWAEHPILVSDCTQDIDLDTIKECVLANLHFFAVFETDGGRMSLLFYKEGDLVHQLVGPQSQLTVGLSDPSLWDPQMGPAADPAEIPGAFSDMTLPFSPYNVTNLGVDTITLTRSDGKMRKTFEISIKGLKMDCHSDQVTTLRIPLVLDPQTRFQSGWQQRYNSLSTANFFKWELKDDLTIEIHSSVPINSRDFTESRSLLAAPEDPNTDFPSGHFLPFPLALVEVIGSGQFSVEILTIQ